MLEQWAAVQAGPDPTGSQLAVHCAGLGRGRRLCLCAGLNLVVLGSLRVCVCVFEVLSSSAVVCEHLGRKRERNPALKM